MGARMPSAPAESSALVRLGWRGALPRQQDPPLVVFKRLEARGSRKRCTPRGPKSSSRGSRSRSSTTSAHGPAWWRTPPGDRIGNVLLSRSLRAKNFNIALDDVSITSLSFGKEFTHAIEAKQVAAQRPRPLLISCFLRLCYCGPFVRFSSEPVSYYFCCEQVDQDDFDSEAKNFNMLWFFTHATEAEQVAAHQAEHAKFIVEKAEQDKKSAIVLYALLTVSVIVTTIGKQNRN
ncbi:hypothetical protein VPH35_094181 [Triticum aestivum]